MGDLLKVMGFLKPYWKKMTGAFIFLLVSSGVMLIQPKLSELAVDEGIRKGDIGTVLFAALAILGTAVVSSYIMFLSGKLLIRSSQNMSYDLRNTLFKRISSFSFSNFDTWRTGELMVRLNSDVNTVRMFCRMGILMLIQAIFILFGAVVLMYQSNAYLAGIMTSIMGGVLVFFLILSFLIRPLFIKVREALDHLNNTLQENLAGAKLVRAFSRQTGEIEKFNRKNRGFFSLSLKAGIAMGIIMPLLVLIGNLALLAVVWSGGEIISRDGMTLGQLTAFNNYAMMSIFPLLMLAMVLNFMVMASASAKRIVDILNTRPALTEAPGARTLDNFQGTIEFDNVSFRYGQGDYALKGINLKIAAGEKIGIIGRTGSGKSSLVHLIPRFYDTSEGTIRLSGSDVRELSFNTVRGHTVLALQETILFSGTIMENIKFGRPGASMEEVQAVAAAACAEEFILRKDKQYDAPVGERGAGLSGGQRQRIAIARSLLTRPDILILDDVTSALDLRTESSIIDNLYGLPGRRTTIIISQKINAVKRADRIIVMDDGRIEAVGSHEQLMATCGIYREIETTQNADAREDEDE